MWTCVVVSARVVNRLRSADSVWEIRRRESRRWRRGAEWTCLRVAMTYVRGVSSAPSVNLVWLNYPPPWYGVHALRFENTPDGTCGVVSRRR